MAEVGPVAGRRLVHLQCHIELDTLSHTDGPALAHTRQVEFQHGLGEIVTSLVEAGPRIEFLHEHDFEAFARFESLQRREDGTYRFPPGQPRVPMMFSRRASAPGVA